MTGRSYFYYDCNLSSLPDLRDYCQSRRANASELDAKPSLVDFRMDDGARDDSQPQANWPIRSEANRQTL